MKNMQKPFVYMFLLIVCLVGCTTGVISSENPIEVGDVQWGRDLDGAYAMSRESGKPIFLFFQEVPG